MDEDIDLPTKLKFIKAGDVSYRFPTDEICDENYPPNDYEAAEKATRKLLLELCEQHLNRKLKRDELVKLPLPVSGHDYIKVYQLYGQSFHARIDGNRREIVTVGMTVKLGDMVNGEFKASEYSYVVYPPMPDWIIENHGVKSVTFKVL